MSYFSLMDNLENLKNIPFKKRERCAVCDNVLTKALINLPNLPQTGIYVQEKTNGIGRVDQKFYLCPVCGHGQIENIVSPSFLYGSSYSFRTSESFTSIEMNKFFISFIKKIMKTEGIESFENIIEIGCNDFYLLNCLSGVAKRVIGIDPFFNGKEEIYSKDKLEVIGDFVENVDLNKYILQGKTAMICSNTLEHIEYPRVMMKKILDSCNDDTLLFFHFPGIEGLIKNRRFDQIFHQHIQYFSLHSFNYLIKEFGGNLIASEDNPDYWAAHLFAFKRGKDERKFKTEKMSEEYILKEYESFKEKMREINSFVEESGEVYGYGAGAIVPMLDYFGGVPFSKLKGFIDDDKRKEGLFYLGYDVPIKTFSENECLSNSTVILTAIDNSRRMLPKLISHNPQHIILLSDFI